MIFFITAGYTLLDHKKNEEILEELKVEPVDEKLIRYKSNLQRLVTRMNNNRMPKIMLNSRTYGRRRLGRPLKNPLDKAEIGLMTDDDDFDDMQEEHSSSLNRLN
jgi:hypothetical protein